MVNTRYQTGTSNAGGNGEINQGSVIPPGPGAVIPPTGDAPPSAEDFRLLAAQVRALTELVQMSVANQPPGNTNGNNNNTNSSRRTGEGGGERELSSYTRDPDYEPPRRFSVSRGTSRGSKHHDHQRRGSGYDSDMSEEGASPLKRHIRDAPPPRKFKMP